MAEQLFADAESYDQTPAWVNSDEFVTRMFGEWPRNDDAWTVQQKVVALDNLYATQLGMWYGWHEVAHHIVSLARDLEEPLRLGSLGAVEILRRVPRADGKPRDCYSFATKYAHFHNPDAYPIYDENARKALVGLTSLLKRETGVHIPTRFRNYAVFAAAHDACRKAWVPDWSRKRFDKALFVGGRRLAYEERQQRGRRSQRKQTIKNP